MQKIIFFLYFLIATWTTVIQCRIAHNNNKNTYSKPYYFVQSCDLYLICKSSWNYLVATPCLLIETMIKRMSYNKLLPNSCHLYNFYYTFFIVLFLTAKFLCVIVINNLFNSIENTYYKRVAHLIHLLSEYRCNLNKTTLTCNLTKLLALVTKKKEKETPTAAKDFL